MLRVRSKSYFGSVSVIAVAVFLITSCGNSPSTRNGTKGLPGMLVEINTRPGVTVNNLIVEPPQPVAAVLF